MRYGWFFAPLAVMTVVVELTAPVAFVGGRLRTLWVALAWSFHVGIVALMAISFPYHLLGIAYAPLFRCERLLRWGSDAVDGEGSAAALEDGLEDRAWRDAVTRA